MCFLSSKYYTCKTSYFILLVITEDVSNALTATLRHFNECPKQMDPFDKYRLPSEGFIITWCDLHTSTRSFPNAK